MCDDQVAEVEGIGCETDRKLRTGNNQGPH